MKSVVLNRVGILRLFLHLTGSGFKTLSGSPIPKHGSSAPPPFPGGNKVVCIFSRNSST